MQLNQRLQKGFLKLSYFNSLLQTRSLSFHYLATSGSIAHASCRHQHHQCSYMKMERNVPRRMYSSVGKVSYVDEMIPVPYGVLGVRIWGDPSKRPILVLHGWKDNLASFDRLIPLLLPSLQDKYYFLAIDLPGHGFSSHFPPGMTYQIADCLLMLGRLIRHYQWTLPINFMGHSLGAILGFLYSATNPGTIDKMVSIDALTPILFRSREILDLIPNAISESLKFEDKLSKGKPPVYPYHEILQRLMNRNMGGLDDMSCKLLLSRGICEAEPGSGLFHFTHDIRVQYLPIMMLSSQQVKFIAENFQSQLLHISAKDGVNYERPYVRNNLESWIRSNPNAKSDRIIKFIQVDGSHHLHLTTPERIAPAIAQFFGP